MSTTIMIRYGTTRSKFAPSWLRRFKMLRLNAAVTPSDPEPKLLGVLGTELGFTDEGPAAALPVVTVAGVPGGVRDFRYLAPLLAERYRVLRLDLPGFGSVHDARWDDYSTSGRARLVAAFAEAMTMSVSAPAPFTIWPAFSTRTVTSPWASVPLVMAFTE